MITHQVTLRYLRIAPRKVRAVAGLLRGLSLNEAEAQLLHQSRRPAKPLLKLLRSALAGVKNRGHEGSSWVIESVRVDQGPMLKRMLPRARGMATPLQKKMSHVTLILKEDESRKAERFSIVRTKKEKAPEKEVSSSTRRSLNKKEREDGESKPQGQQSPTFLKRVFTRKSGMGNG